MATRQCPYCKQPMVDSKKHGSSIRRASKDHIFPQEWNPPDIEGVNNIRKCCQRCNSDRAAVGHCIGALACVMHIAKLERQDITFIIRRWSLQRIASLIPRPT